MEIAFNSLLSERYRIISRLGSGGMADVFRARDINLQRDVAIKLLHEDLIYDPSFRARFLQEARSAANLAHPNIVTIFDFGEDNGRYFIAMEFIDGTDLKTFIRRLGHLSIHQAIDFMIQICAGVGYAHRAGLVHCDLKPQNVLVTTDNRTKITDFGISRALATINPNENHDIVWGSPQYFSPEQACGAPPSPASDVYSLGIILFEMLSGQLPFIALDTALLAEMHLHEPPPSLSSFNPEIPTTLEQILHKVLSKEPSARYRTADQFGQVLKTFVNIDTPMPITQTPSIIYSASSVSEASMDFSEKTSLARVDWLAVILSLLAFLAVGGLIPLWLWACLLYPSCPINAW